MQQDYIPFGCSNPIIVAPREVVLTGGVPVLRVWDPDFYIQVRDILLARQMGANPILAPGQWQIAPSPLHPIGAPPEEGEDLVDPLLPSPTSEAHIEKELREYVDRMLGALSTQNLLEGSRILSEALAFVGGNNPRLRQLVGIYGRLLNGFLKNRKPKERERESESEGNQP